MSTTVENRVVQLEFDNRNFESNVKTSLSTLDKLKEKLKFNDAGKGLDKLADATGNVDIDRLGTAVENVKVKFSALEIVAITALSNIASKAIDAGEKFVKSLTVDQISEGFSKYEKKTQAVQTILAATASAGETMDTVSEKLEQLLWFTDETSYDFVQMADNIGKFTSANVSLQDSVDAMQGIATWAALSGSNAATASRVMYNFSQAFGTGHMMVKDWMSVENANMATMEFKNTALEVAAAMGTIKRNADGTFTAINNKGKAVIVTAENFRDSLSAGWFGTKEMTETLKTYGGFATELSKLTDAANISTNQALEFLEDFKAGELDLAKASEQTSISAEDLRKELERLSGSDYDLGFKAFRAAQEAKTITDAINYVKDAASSSWMQTFEHIFGNYEEAKVLWTDLTDRLYHVFVESGEKRNALLEGWHDGGYEMLVQSFWNTIDAIVNVLDTVKQAWKDVFGELDTQTLLDWTKKLLEFTEKFKMSDKTAEAVRGTFKGLFTVLKVGLGIVKALFAIAKPIVSVIFKLLGGILGVTGAMGNGLSDFAEWLNDTEKFKKIGNAIASVLEKIVDLFIRFKNFAGPIVKQIPSVLNSIFKSITGKDFSEVVVNFKDIGNNLVDGFVNGVREKWEWLKSKKDDIFGFFRNIIDWVKDLLGIHSPSTEMMPVGRSLIDGFIEGARERFEKIKQLASDFFKAIFGAFGSKEETDTEGVTIGESVIEKTKRFAENLGGLFEKIKPIAATIGGTIVSIVKNGISALVNAVNSLDAKNVLATAFAVREFAKSIAFVVRSISISQILSGVGSLFKGIGKIVKNTASFMSTANKAFKQKIVKPTTFKDVAESLLMIAASLLLIFVAVKVFSTMSAGELLKGFGILVGILVGVTLFVRQMKRNTPDKKDILALSAFFAVLGAMMLKIAASIMIISKSGSPGQILAAGGVLFAILLLVGVISVLLTKNSKNVKTIDKQQLNAMSTLFAILGRVIKQISKAIKRIAKASAEYGQDAVTQAGIVLGGIFAIMGLTVWLITKNLNGKKGSKVSTSSAKQLEAMKDIFVAMAVVCVAIGFAMKLILSSGGSMGEIIAAGSVMAAMLIVMGVVVGVLSKNTKNGAKASGNSIKQLEAMAVVFGVLALVCVAIGYAMRLIITAGSMSQIITAGAVMTVMLGVMGIIVGVLSKNTKNGAKASASSVKQLETMAIVFGVLALVCVAIGYAMKTIISAGSIGEIITAGIVMAAMLAIMALIMKMMTSSGSLSGGSVKSVAAAFLSMAAVFVAIGLFVQMFVKAISALMSLGDPGSVIKMMGMLTLVIVAIAGITLLMSKIPAAGAVMGVAAFAVALIAIAGAILLVAVALKKIVEAFAQMEQVGPSGADNFAQSLQKLMSVIPTFFRELGNGVVEFLNVLAEQAPQIKDAVTTLLKTALEAFDEQSGMILNSLVKLVLNVCSALMVVGPVLIETVARLIDSLLKSLADHMPSYAKSIVSIIVSLLTEIEANAEEISSLLYEIMFDWIMGAMDAIIAKAPELADKFAKMVISIINGVADAINNNIDELKAAIDKLGKAVVNAVNVLFGNTEDAAEDASDEGQGPFEKIGRKIIRSFLNGIKGMTEEIIKGGSEIIISVIKGIGEESVKIADEAGNTIIAFINGLSDSISSKATELAAALIKLRDSFIELLLSLFGIRVFGGEVTLVNGKMRELGENVIKGFLTGLSKAWEWLKETKLGKLFLTILDKFNKDAGVASPSKKTMWTGEMVMEGLRVGLLNKVSSVKDAVGSATDKVIGAFGNAMNTARDLVDADTAGTITITPVLDLSRFNEDSAALNEQLGSAKTLDFAATMSYADQAYASISRSTAGQISESGYDKLTSLLQRLVESPPSQNHNEFYITGDDPEDIADEVSAALQRDIIRRNAVWA